MKLALQTRFSVLIIGLILALVGVLSGGLLVQFRDSSSEIRAANSEAASAALLGQVDKHAVSLARTMADSLTNHLYFYQSDFIADLAMSARRQYGVIYVYVLEPGGKIVHDGTETLESYGLVLNDTYMQKTLASRGVLTWTTGDGARQREQGTPPGTQGPAFHVSAPVILGEKAIGAVRIGISLREINADIAAAQTQLTGISDTGTQRAILVAALTTLVLVLMGAFLSFIVARRLSLPITALARATHEIGEGHFDVHIPVDRTDEIGDLATAIGDMAHERMRAEMLLQSRSLVLERLATGAPLQEILTLLVSSAEVANPEMLGSVLLYDAAENVLRHGAAPRLPDAYNRAVDGLVPGPAACSCGAAVHTRERVIVEDVQTHPYWADFRELAVGADVRACWSQPILAADGSVLGTFAVYYREPRGPTPSDLEIIEGTAQLARIAIEHKRAEEAQKEIHERHQRFAADVAHELRTPLAIMRTQLDNLGNREMTGALTRDLQAMSRLVSQLMESTRLDNLSLDTDERVDLREICAGVATMLAPIAIREGGGIELTGSQKPVMVFGNAHSLELAVRNLVENALRYSDRGTSVIIDVRNQPAVSVINKGPGIPADRRDAIFERFERADRRGGGAGLGLSIVKRIVETHNGTIDVGDAPDGGTIFTIRMPRTNPSAAPISAVQSI